MRWAFAIERHECLPDGSLPEPRFSGGGGGGDVRRGNDVGSLKQRVIRRRRFHREDIKARAKELSMLQRVPERGFIHDSAARSVHENRAVFHFCEPIPINQIASAGG